MQKDKKHTGKLALGIFVDGSYLRTVCLEKHNRKIKLVDVQSYSLTDPIDAEVSARLLSKSSTMPAHEPLEELPEIKIVDLEQTKQSSHEHKISPLEVVTVGEHSGDNSLRANSTSSKFWDETPNEIPLDIELLLQESRLEEEQLAAEPVEPLDLSAEIEELDLIKEQKSPATIQTPVETKPETTPLTINADLEEDLLKLESAAPPARKVKPKDERPLDITSGGFDNSEPIIDHSEQKKVDNSTILFRVLSKYSQYNYQIAISLPEPQIYYNYFDTDWNLEGKKLNARIIEELSKEKLNDETIAPEAIQFLKIANGKLLVIARDSEVSLINLLEESNLSLKKRLPKITLVESAEISLVNLVKHNYRLKAEEISVIIYIGHEFSRLIFMNGNELLHISPIIGEGVDSYLIFGYSLGILANTLRSRLLLEQDELNLSKINNIILAGEACRDDVKSVLAQSFPEDVKVETIQLGRVNCNDVHPSLQKELPQVAVALGAALRALEIPTKNLYTINLTPVKIREEQNIFKLGIIGWIALGLIPLLTFYFTIAISQKSSELKRLEAEQKQKKAELARLKDVEQQVAEANKKLNYYVETFGALDSMVIGTQTWSDFLLKLTRETKKSGCIWITDINTSGPTTANLLGYSTIRQRIPQFSDALGQTILKEVKVQEIRKSEVYNFNITADVFPSQPKFSNENEVKEELPTPGTNDPIISKNTEAPKKDAVKTVLADKKKVPPNDTKVEIPAAPVSEVSSIAEFKQQYNLGLQYFGEYRYYDAIEVFLNLLKSEMQTNLKFNCAYWVGECYFGTGKFEQAIEYFNKSLVAGSNKIPASLYMIGKSYQKLNKPTEAQPYFKRIIDEYPENPMAEYARKGVL
jgi:TolA-binding protein